MADGQMLRLRGTCFQNRPPNESRFWLASDNVQDWLLVIGKLNIHGYIIKGLFFELFHEE